MSERAAVALESLPKCPKPESEEIILPIAGSWKISHKLALSLSAMFRACHGFTPSQREIDMYVSNLLEAEVASFRLRHRGEINHFGKPPMRPTDPTKQIREVSHDE